MANGEEVSDPEGAARVRANYGDVLGSEEFAFAARAWINSVK
jgi:hypothetical protein